jgi:hypothetical protein
MRHETVMVLIENVVIDGRNAEACLDAINALYVPDVMRSRAQAGAFGVAPSDENVLSVMWYMYTSNPGRQGFGTLEEAFNAWRYAVDVGAHNAALPMDNTETVRLAGFMGNVWGQDELLYETIAPYVDRGGVITVWRGDALDAWRYVFYGSAIKQQAVIGWRNA